MTNLHKGNGLDLKIPSVFLVSQNVARWAVHRLVERFESPAVVSYMKLEGSSTPFCTRPAHTNMIIPLSTSPQLVQKMFLVNLESQCFFIILHELI